jgi:hypothetical protein
LALELRDLVVQLGEARRVTADPPGDGAVAQAALSRSFTRNSSGFSGRGAATLGRRRSCSATRATAVRQKVGSFISQFLRFFFSFPFLLFFLS